MGQDDDKKGRIPPAEESAPTIGADGHFRLTREDILKYQQSLKNRMDQLVGTDELTGLMAKHRFDAALGEALRTARHTGTYLSVMMMDMDRLKQVNDTHGHHMGANTIRQVGQQIGEIVTGLGEACRFGGDEFSAFLRGFPLAAAGAAGPCIFKPGPGAAAAAARGQGGRQQEAGGCGVTLHHPWRISNTGEVWVFRRPPR